MYPMGARVREFRQPQNPPQAPPQVVHHFPARRMTFNEKVCLMLFCFIAVISLVIIWILLTDTPHEPPTVHHFSYRIRVQMGLAASPGANANLSDPAITVPSQNYPKAVEHYSESLRRNSNNLSTYSNRAACCTEIGDFAMAVGLKNTKKFIELDPAFCEARARQCPKVQCIPTILAVTQEHHFSSLQRETEKLRTDLDKMRTELRYEIDRVTADQQLDLNLETGHIWDELANQKAETSNLTKKLDREIHGLRAQLEAAKYDAIKYCIGTLVSISAVGLAVVLLLL